MSEYGSKREIEKRKAKEREDKAQKMRERKANASKGKSLEDMMMYLDENGNFTSTPPDPNRKKEINPEDIQLGAARREEGDGESNTRTGVVTFFNDAKGYGFISDSKNKQSVFVHINQLSGIPLKEHDKVTFETESGPKGLNAVNVKKI